MAKKLTILVGIPGSGKSTLAAKMNATVVSSDKIRVELTGDIKDQSRNDEVFKIFAQRIKDALGRGEHVVVDSTAVQQRAQELLQDIARRAKIRPTVVIFTDEATARARNARRDPKGDAPPVPDHIMDDMAENLKDIRHYLREHSGRYARIMEVK